MEYNQFKLALGDFEAYGNDCQEIAKQLYRQIGKEDEYNELVEFLKKYGSGGDESTFWGITLLKENPRIEIWQNDQDPDEEPEWQILFKDFSLERNG